MMCVMRAEPPPELAFEEVVARVPFLRALSPPERERLRPYARVRALTPGESIWQFHDDIKEFVFVLEGHLKLCRPSESGRDVILDVAAPGELLCASAVLNHDAACCTCAALNGPVLVVALARRDVLQLLEQSSVAASAFVREATGRDVRLTRRMFELTMGQVEQRIATLLLRLAEQLGQPTESRQIQIPLRLSRQDIADLCGTTLETAIRTMTRFAREGIIRSGHLGPIVVDRRRLEAAARGEAVVGRRRGPLRTAVGIRDGHSTRK